MTDQDQDFGVLLAATMGLYGPAAPKITKTGLAIWAAALEGYSLADIRAALSAHVKSPDAGMFPPKPADIIRILAGTSAERSTIAWGIVERAIRSVGGYQSVVFDDPAIHAAIESIGGWHRLTQTSEPELPFVAKRFEAVYRTFAQRPGFEYPARLIGAHEADNAAAGHHGRIPPPVMIGDTGRCAAVANSGRQPALHHSAPAPALSHIRDALALKGPTA